jgi:hypothetical protein
MVDAGDRSGFSRVRTTRPPKFVAPWRPVALRPARIGTSCPSTRPMRRLKKGKRLSPPRPTPKEKISAASRKNVRFSGKKSGKRVRLVWRASTSVSGKSVFV